MKLVNIFESKKQYIGSIPVVYTSHPPKTVAGRSVAGRLVRSKELKKDPNYIGSGADADVYDLPKHGNAVIKYIELSNDSDIDELRTMSSVVFINMCIEHDDNPFFPKIYNAKIIGFPYEGNTAFVLIVQMEKLHPINKTELQDISKIVLTNLGVDEKIVNNEDILMYYLVDPGNILKLRNKTKNPMFKQTLDILEPYLLEFGNDLHDDNWMLRLTSVGPQLVITDPFHTTF